MDGDTNFKGHEYAEGRMILKRVSSYGNYRFGKI